MMSIKYLKNNFFKLKYFWKVEDNLLLSKNLHSNLYNPDTKNLRKTRLQSSSFMHMEVIDFAPTSLSG